MGGNGGRRLTVGVTLTVALILLFATVAAAAVWPGPQAVVEVDAVDESGGNLSGLAYEGTGTATPGVLWVVRNGPGELLRMVWDGTVWSPDTNNDWVNGKNLQFVGGGGDVDAEGVTIAANDSAFLYVASERDNNNNGVSRPSVLRYDVTASGTSLAASMEWNLTADLPASVPNGGIESITWIPDAALVGSGFVDEVLGQLYDPANHPNHGTGLFAVGHEATGQIYLYALDHSNGSPTRIASFASGLSNVMALEFDADLGELWTACDGTCMNALTRLEITPAGVFAVAQSFDRPTGLPDENNEGFTIAPMTECVSNERPVFWADDNETDGHALRRGSMSCVVPAEPVDMRVVTLEDSDGNGLLDYTLDARVPGASVEMYVDGELTPSSSVVTTPTGMQDLQVAFDVLGSVPVGSSFLMCVDPPLGWEFSSVGAQSAVDPEGLGRGCGSGSVTEQQGVLGWSSVPFILEASPLQLCNGLIVTVDIGAGEVATSGADVILGTSGADVIVALGGDDTVCGLGGGDTINGGPGA
ncbi:MAG: hypothetical protein ACI81L_001576, partial [Verrucomicrobiales bacterium]